MRGMLRAELMRVRSRSAFWGTLVVLLVACAGLVIAAWDDTRPPSDAAVAQAHLDLDDALASWEDEQDWWTAECEDAEDPWFESVDCDTFGRPVLEQFLPYRDGLAEVVDSRFAPIGGLLVLGLLIMGTSLAAADFASGAMATWLTFQPRRARVVGSRLLAAATATVPLALAVLTAAALGMAGVVAWNGAMQDGGQAAASIAAYGWRAVVAALWGVVLGTGLAFTFRHSAAVIGVVVWWVAAVETALPTILPTSRGVTLVTNLRAWTEGGATYVTETCRLDAAKNEVCDVVEHVISQTQGGLVMLGVAAVVVGLGLLVFRLRDVG